ncbi:CFC_collapsed_G0003320.mRNA.1.CDS.1 [Saccharomyces cerevisiae]|nr:CFC_collapsed_G0003320.mRNA.1.CDS.1 [Saccharomyces cerevisiae]
MDVVSEEPLIEWLAANYKNFGATLEFITDKSSEGAQFVTGFGGIGAMLRYKVNFEQLVDESEDEYYDEDEGSDYDFI